MDYDTLTADVNYILPYHYTAGRDGSIKFVVLHWNAGNLTVEQCYSVWYNNEASAHYQVESSGRIGQLVWDTDTAWATGNYYGNNNGISIEHANIGDEFTDECITNGAKLTGAICKYYGLGEPEWGVNVFPHKHFSATACPGTLATTYKDRYMSIAKDFYNGKDLEEDMTPEQAKQLDYIYTQLSRTDTAGHTANPDGHDFYGRLQIIEEQVKDMHTQLTRTDTAGHNTPDGHDFYGRLQMIEEDIEKIKDNLSK